MPMEIMNVANPGPIWDSIEIDLTAAMSVLPKTQPQIGRANFYAAEAFLAKTYMFDHQYAHSTSAFDRHYYEWYKLSWSSI